MRRRDRLATHNERVKLFVTTSNAVGLAFIALGVVRPLVDPGEAIRFATLGFALTGLALHGVAYYLLSQLETET